METQNNEWHPWKNIVADLQSDNDVYCADNHANKVIYLQVGRSLETKDHVGSSTTGRFLTQLQIV